MVQALDAERFHLAPPLNQIRVGGHSAEDKWFLPLLHLLNAGYQEFPTSIQYEEAIARRRKEERRASSASCGMVRRLGRFSSRVRHQGVPDRERGPDRCHASGATVDVCGDAPAGAPRAPR